MISGFAQNGHAEEALELFREMQLLDQELNSAIMARPISSCSQLGTLFCLLATILVWSRDDIITVIPSLMFIELNRVTVVPQRLMVHLLESAEGGHAESVRRTTRRNKSSGAEWKCILLDVEEEEKEAAVGYHSEETVISL
ncbi:hypothetical protein Ancab_027560 [Ancistrocladus abbreviatus]